MCAGLGTVLLVPYSWFYAFQSMHIAQAFYSNSYNFQPLLDRHLPHKHRLLLRSAQTASTSAHNVLTQAVDLCLKTCVLCTVNNNNTRPYLHQHYYVPYLYSWPSNEIRCAIVSERNYLVKYYNLKISPSGLY